MSNDMPTGTTYFQYISNRSDSFGPQVFFWFTNQGGATNTWLQFITSYDQAGEIAKWLGDALNGNSPAAINLSVSGGTLSFSSTATAITISGDDGGGTSLSDTFNIAGFQSMLVAVLFSIKSMVQNDSDFTQGAVNHPLLQKVKGE